MEINRGQDWPKPHGMTTVFKDYGLVYCIKDLIETDILSQGDFNLLSILV